MDDIYAMFGDQLGIPTLFVANNQDLIKQRRITDLRLEKLVLR